MIHFLVRILAKEANVDIEIDSKAFHWPYQWLNVLIAVKIGNIFEESKTMIQSQLARNQFSVLAYELNDTPIESISFFLKDLQLDQSSVADFLEYIK